MKQMSRIKKNMSESQALLADRTVEASSGGGGVKAVVRCDGTVQSIAIDPSVINAEELSLLEDMVVTAVNNGINLAKEVSDEEMSKLATKYNVPPDLMGM